MRLTLTHTCDVASKKKKRSRKKSKWLTDILTALPTTLWCNYPGCSKQILHHGMFEDFLHSELICGLVYGLEHEYGGGGYAEDSSNNTL